MVLIKVLLVTMSNGLLIAAFALADMIAFLATVRCASHILLYYAHTAVHKGWRTAFGSVILIALYRRSSHIQYSSSAFNYALIKL